MINPQTKKEGDKPCQQSAVNVDKSTTPKLVAPVVCNPAPSDPAAHGDVLVDQQQSSLEWLTGPERLRVSFRLWSQVKMVESGCWEWTNSKRTSGYGNIRIRGVLISTHRLAYMLSAGSIPAGMLICHTCDNKLCCNPVHLFLGTFSDNMKDSVLKGRFAMSPFIGKQGEENNSSKLTGDEVRRIRQLKGIMTHKQIVTLFGVGPTCIDGIMKGTSWKHI